ncbi:MAG TPA: MauE/DoxX family redox-associated membrane protein [Thermoanaerobaculia bacterium]|nr:MauE/DoxX family redox-associated membrane protein [Thermoanaerobaculia bacterium]
MSARGGFLSRGAVLAGRLILGAVFIVAAGPKIMDPPGFAHMIANYRLFPVALVHAAALVLPWVEMLCGLALVSGVFWRTAAKLVSALLVVFILAIGANLARDRAVNCGCFDVHAAAKTHAELIAEMRWVLVRDAALLAVGVLVLRGRRRRSAASAGALLLLLLSAGCRPSPPAAPARSEHALRGVITAIDAGRREITVRHEAIPGYMAAMTMPYPVDPSVRLDALRPGDAITARLVVEGPRSRLDEISVVERTGRPGEAATIDPSKIAAVGSAFPDFHLVDQNARPFALSDFRGKPVVLAFIYTRCPLPWACPATVAGLARVGASDPSPHFVLVTVDPKNDTPEVLRDYSRQVDVASGRWTFATGDPSAIADVAAHAGAIFERDGSSITHSLVVVAIGPDGKVLGRHAGRDWKSEDVLRDLSSRTK